MSATQQSLWGVRAERLGSSRLGPALGWAKGDDGKPALYTSQEAATSVADTYNRTAVSANVQYWAERYE